jgi:hypothetical protein
MMNLKGFGRKYLLLLLNEVTEKEKSADALCRVKQWAMWLV